MSSEPISKPAPWWHGPLLMGGLLLVEYLGLSYTFDVQPLKQGGGFAGAMGNLGMLIPILAVSLTAFVAFARKDVLVALKQAPVVTWRARLTGIAIQVTCFAILWWLSEQVLVSGTVSPEAQRARTSYSGLLWGWLLAALGVGLSALHIAAPLPWLYVQLKRFRFALSLSALVGLSAWGAGIASSYLWETLGDSTMTASAQLLALFYTDTYTDHDRDILGAGSFFVHIAPVCSGFESIGLMTVLLGAYLFGFRRQLRFPQALLLLPASITLAWLANIARVTALIALGTSYSPSMALGAFHSKAGWLLFSALALGAVALSRHRWFRREPCQGESDELPPTSSKRDPSAAYGRPSAPYLIPFVGLLGASLLTGTFFAPFDPLYGVRVVVVFALLYRYRSRLLPQVQKVSWLSPVVGLAVLPIWLALSPAPDGKSVADFSASLEGLPQFAFMLWACTRVLGGVVAVPIVEELAFRGFLLRRIESPDFEALQGRALRPLGLVVSSVAFGALHQQWIAGTLAGLMYGGLYLWRRGRLADAIIAHATTNLGLAVLALQGKDWSLWM